MKSFRKKSAPVMPAWHPDFRSKDKLPDVKAVRTSFFINGASVLLLLILAISLAIQEFRQFNLENDIQLLEAKIAEQTPRNTEVLQMNNRFVAHQRLINEVVGYLDGSMELSGFLVALGETLHPEMTLSNIRYQGTGGRATGAGQITITGSIFATPEAAAGVITDYLNVFHENPFLAGMVGEAEPSSLVPTPEGDRMAFGIRLMLIDETDEKAKGAAK